MADNNIDLTATFDVSGATKSVSEFGKSATKSIDDVNKSVSNFASSIDKTSKTKLNLDTSKISSNLDGLSNKLKVVGASILAYFSVSAISGFFSTMISESTDAENNLNQLNAALARTGQLTPQVSASMSKFSTDLMAVSTIDDDVINGQLAIALNFTKTADKAQELVGAAANLSAAMKIDLGTAVELLGKTLDGTAGRLNETVPALRGVSEAALKSGAAIEIVNRQFAGAATSEINTYSGSLKQLSNVFGNFAASLGNMIVQNPMVSQAMKELSKAFIGATAAIEDGTSSSISFVNRGLVAIISGIRDLIPSINTMASFMKSIAWLFDLLVKSGQNFVDALKIMGNSWLWLVGTMEGKKSALSGIEESFKKITERADDLSTSLMNIGKDAFTKVDISQFDAALKRIQDSANKPINVGINVKNAKLDDLLKDIELKPPKDDTKEDLIPLDPAAEAEKKRLQSFRSVFQKYSDWLDDTKKNWEKEQSDINWEKFFTGNSDEISTEFEWLSSNIKAIAASFIPSFKSATYFIARGMFEVADYMSRNLPSIVSSVSGIILAMGQGAEGAKTAIPAALKQATTAVGGAIGAIWGPLSSALGQAIGSMVGDIIKLASQPIGETLKSIDDFMEAVPILIDEMAANLPTVMNKIFEKLPNLLIMILKALPAVMRASASAMKPLFKEIGKDSVPMIGVLLDVLWESVAMVVMAIGYAIQGLALGLSDYMKEKAPDILVRMNQFFQGIGDIFTDLKNALASISMNSIGAEIQKGIDKIVAGFTNFFNMFGKFFQNIGDRLGGFFEGLFGEDLSSSIKSDVTGKISDFFSKTFSMEKTGDFFKKIGDWFGSVFSMDNLSKVVQSLIDGVKNIFSKDTLAKIGNSITDGFKGLFAKLVPSGGGGGGGGGLVSGTGTPLDYLAKGGIVPAGFPNDTYPAMLTSNEVVVPASSAPSLFNLIDKLSSGETNTTGNNETNQLLKQLISIIANQQTQIDVKLDRDTLARAILSLNKDNRRLA